MRRLHSILCAQNRILRHSFGLAHFARNGQKAANVRHSSSLRGTNSAHVREYQSLRCTKLFFRVIRRPGQRKRQKREQGNAARVHQYHVRTRMSALDRSRQSIF